eukprot:s1203_g9.t1
MGRDGFETCFRFTKRMSNMFLFKNGAENTVVAWNSTDPSSFELLKSQSSSLQLSVLARGVITDASFANASKGRSQGAYSVIAYDQHLLEKGYGRCNLLHWRSGKIHRVANSTLAAETQSLSRGLGELSWMVTVFNELVTPGFDLKRCEESLLERKLRAFARS